MAEQTIECLEDIWPLQAELNRRAGFDTRAIGVALSKALDSGELPAEGGHGHSPIVIPRKYHSLRKLKHTFT